MGDIFLIIILILNISLGLTSIGIPIYSLIKKENFKINKNLVLLTYIFLVLALVSSLLIYLGIKSIGDLEDVTGVFKRYAILLWLTVLLCLLVNKNIRKNEINKIKYLSMMTLNLVLAHYVINNYMIMETNVNASKLESPLHLVIIFSIIALSLIAYEWMKKNK